MLIGFVHSAYSEHPRSLPQLAAEVAARVGRAVIFTSEKAAEDTHVFADLHIALGESIRPVTVRYRDEGRVRFFYLPGEKASAFAVSMAAVLNRQMAAERVKPDFLHLLNAEAVPAILLSKKYFRIPYIYSVASFQELKLPLRELQLLGLSPPPGCAALGDRCFAEHLAGMEADYLIDESGGAHPESWGAFFSPFAGKLIAGHPAVDVGFWAENGTDEQRERRKRQWLESRGYGNQILVVLQTADMPAVMPEGTACFRLEHTMEENRTLLQSADIFLCDSKGASPGTLLAAMAAGCIPVAPAAGFAKVIIQTDDIGPGGANGFLYGMETPLEALERVLRDLREPGRAGEVRFRAARTVKEGYGLGSLASLYESVYRGIAPVKLPFITAMTNQAQNRRELGGTAQCTEQREIVFI